MFSYTSSGLCRLDTSFLSCWNVGDRNTFLWTTQSYCNLVNPFFKPDIIQSLWYGYWPMGYARVDKSTALQRLSMSTSEWLIHNVFPHLSPRKETSLHFQQLIIQKWVGKSESSLHFTKIIFPRSPHSVYWHVLKCKRCIYVFQEAFRLCHLGIWQTSRI